MSNFRPQGTDTVPERLGRAASKPAKHFQYISNQFTLDGAHPLPRGKLTGWQGVSAQKSKSAGPGT